MLDNPLWHSLATVHAAHARGAGDVRRYPKEVVPFVAAAAEGAEADGAIVEPGETVYSVGPRPVLRGCTREDLGVIAQLVSTAPIAAPESPAIRELGERDRDEVLALAALVYPHYFRPRTPELGRYFGIFDGGTLAAMIGERMGMPGYREISAVCTHPDHTGRGLARALLAFLVADLGARGITPFLHVSPANTRAVQLYEQNGFVRRADMRFTAFRR